VNAVRPSRRGPAAAPQDDEFRELHKARHGEERSPERVSNHAGTRRALLGGALALAACKGRAQVPPRGPAPALRGIAPFPVGCAVMSGQLADPAFASLLARQVSQLTPEWELKMEYVLKDDGTFRFDAPDAIAAFARAHGMRLMGHTLVWYAQKPVAFARIDGQRRAFEGAYRNYVLAVAGRYRGIARGWDVVNEALDADGALRDCLWRSNLGEDYVRLAFEHAAEADPDAVLLLNDYDLESRPAKRAGFLRLAESLLKAGAPLKGLGTQSHMQAGLEPGRFTAALRELASLGLPIHVSEIDISLGGGLFPDRSERLTRQARLYGEAAEAFTALPARQRFGFTIWGLRDQDSWIRRNEHQTGDAPLLFDDAGQAKPALWAVAEAFEGRLRAG
jgi:endo-1,4-beta-xylanase